MRRPGRPKKANKKEKQVKFFMTATDYFMIQHKAAKAGQTIPECMRQLALTGQVKIRWKVEDMDLFHKMIEMANNIHGLVEVALREGALDAVRYFEKYRGHMDYIIERLERTTLEGVRK